MAAFCKSSSTSTPDKPLDEQTQIQRIGNPRTIPVSELEYHLFAPRRAYAPLLESAYQLWRDVWQSTWEEANVATPMYSDEFTRQDEVAVLAHNGSCIAVTCLRWLDLAQASSIEDSYFKHWPREALAKVGGRLVCVGSNTAIDPSWRRAAVLPPQGDGTAPVRLAFALLSLGARRFLTSPADCLIALTRNDRAIDRILAALGSGTPLAHIKICGNDTYAVCLERHNTLTETPVVNDLWLRRRDAW